MTRRRCATWPEIASLRAFTRLHVDRDASPGAGDAVAPAACRTTRARGRWRPCVFVGMQPVLTQVPPKSFALDDGDPHPGRRRGAPRERTRPARLPRMIAS